jgi:hypothetical protein
MNRQKIEEVLALVPVPILIPIAWLVFGLALVLLALM